MILMPQISDDTTNENARYKRNDIRSVSVALQTQSRFVKFVRGGDDTADKIPYKFYKPTLGPK